MKNLKPKYFLVYSRQVIEEIQRPEGWNYLCAGNFHELMQEVLNVQKIATELKLIWNDQHRRDLLKDYDVTNEILNDYVAANCGTLIFQSPFAVHKAYRKLVKMGAKSPMVIVSRYRDVIIEQGLFFHKTGTFSQQSQGL